MMSNSGNPLFGIPNNYGPVGANSNATANQDSSRLIAAVADAQVNRFYSRVPLPTNLQGYVRYVVVLDPQDSKPYSIGIKYVCRSKGADEVLTRLSENVNRRHKKRVHAWLCKCCPSSSICPAEWNCPDIHVTPVGYSNRRPWTQALGPNPRKADGSRGEDEDSWSDDEGGAAQQKKPHAAPFLGSSEEEVTYKGALEQFPDLASFLPNFAHPTARFSLDSTFAEANALGIDPNLLKSVQTAASTESSQLATQLACLNVDLQHMARVSNELRLNSAPARPPAAPPATGPIGLPAAPPPPGHPLFPASLQPWGQPFDLGDLMGRLGPVANGDALPTIPAPTAPAATLPSQPVPTPTPLPPTTEPSAADITQNIINILTSLNVVTLLNQIASTLTDPAQLLLINQLASQISSQITGPRVPEAANTPITPSQMANLTSLANLLGAPSGFAGVPSPPPATAPMAPPQPPQPSVPHIPATPTPQPAPLLPNLSALLPSHFFGGPVPPSLPSATPGQHPAMPWDAKRDLSLPDVLGRQPDAPPAVTTTVDHLPGSFPPKLAPPAPATLLEQIWDLSGLASAVPPPAAGLDDRTIAPNPGPTEAGDAAPSPASTAALPQEAAVGADVQ